ncbi:hypothetical protein G6L37_28925 [Agrobacterium rubi]|uniref:hypothetical protein n=1 Tax=Agrobacterium rubi TaxID=28099 RepID=UPI0015723083|nr:hypothetical protein [Agrobacterium rubi]NTF09534.1 hypothetical protein [Agrobacterium rubi]NTF22441.1 hypothetical protein [Agrobacterium rubi]NTF29298.1 hypothetical protein [Agrobacterium rubi]
MHDMTMSEALKDPLIRKMLRADKVSLRMFATLLETAAKERTRNLVAKSLEKCALPTMSAEKQGWRCDAQ